MHSKKARILLLLGDITAIILTFILSGYLAQYISEDLLAEPYYGFAHASGIHHAVTFTLLGGIFLFLLFNRGHYKRRIPWWNQVRYIFTLCLFLLMVEGFIFYLTKYAFSRLWVGLSWVLLPFIMLSIRQIIRSICDHLLKCWKIDTYIFGNGDGVIDTILAIQSDKFVGYNIKAVITDSKEYAQKPNASFFADKNIDVQMSLPDASTIKKNENFYILAADYWNDKQKLIRFFKKHIIEKNITHAIIPPAKNLSFYDTSPQYFFGHDVMFLISRDKIHSPFGKASKRLFDIAGSGLGLLILSPAMLLLTLLVKRDGGPAFFAHARVGHNGEIFKCWKFRSMAVDAKKRLETLLATDPAAKEEWEKDFKLRNDPRITRLGKFMRDKSIDELPQLWNVFKGDMSLVGPRPIVEEEIKYYGNALSHYTSVKPGITGLWQVSGRNDTGYAQRVYFDSWYVRHWNIFHDIVILFKTIKAVIKKDGAY